MSGPNEKPLTAQEYAVSS